MTPVTQALQILAVIRQHPPRDQYLDGRAVVYHLRHHNPPLRPAPPAKRLQLAVAQGWFPSIFGRRIRPVAHRSYGHLEPLKPAIDGCGGVSAGVVGSNQGVQRAWDIWGIGMGRLGI